MIELFNDCEVEFIVVDEAFKPIIEAIKPKVDLPAATLYHTLCLTTLEGCEDCTRTLHSPYVGTQVPSLKRFIYAGDAATPAGCLSYEHMLTAAAAVPDAMRGGDDTFGLFYTGGT